MAIFSHNIAADIVESIEDVLIKNDIRVPSPEDEDREPDDTGFYGSVWSELIDSVEVMLLEMLEEHKSDSEVIPYVYG